VFFVHSPTVDANDWEAAPAVAPDAEPVAPLQVGEMLIRLLTIEPVAPSDRSVIRAVKLHPNAPPRVSTTVIGFNEPNIDVVELGEPIAHGDAAAAVSDVVAVGAAVWQKTTCAELGFPVPVVDAA